MTERSLAVATPQASYLLPLEFVIELTDWLPVGPPPTGSPYLAGVAIYRDETLPVYSLDVVLGEAAHGARSWEDRDWGGFVIAVIDGRRCALGVSRVIGLVPRTGASAALDLPALLAPILPDAAMMAPVAVAELPATARYLVVEAGPRRCAVPVQAVERVQANCRTVRAAGAGGTVLVGVGTVDGRVLPVIDLSALLGGAGTVAPSGFVVVATVDIGRLILAVDRILGLTDIAGAALASPPEGTPSVIIAVAAEGETWILSPALITAQRDRGR